MGKRMTACTRTPSLFNALPVPQPVLPFHGYTIHMDPTETDLGLTQSYPHYGPANEDGTIDSIATNGTPRTEEARPSQNPALGRQLPQAQLQRKISASLTALEQQMGCNHATLITALQSNDALLLAVMAKLDHIEGKLNGL